MEPDHNSASQIMLGIESAETLEIYTAIRALRRFVRLRAVPEGMMDDWCECPDIKSRMATSWQTLEESDNLLMQFGLCRNTLWLWPTCVLVIGHKASKQWITIRGHAVPFTALDIPSSRLLCINGMLQVFLGASHQTAEFEEAIYDLAYRTLGLGEK